MKREFAFFEKLDVDKWEAVVFDVAVGKIERDALTKLLAIIAVKWRAGRSSI